MYTSLNTFLSKQQNKPVVLVQGLGFVGSVMSLVVANAVNGDYAVIGVDQDTETGRRTVDSLNAGVWSSGALQADAAVVILDSCKNYP
jgi:UDP-N-acetyl-D-mannosaminuronate dehydrogenase